MLLTLIIAGQVVALAKWRSHYLELQSLRAFVDDLPDEPAIPALSASLTAPSTNVDTRILQDAGTALANPPADLRLAIAALQQRRSGPELAFPLGWRMVNATNYECVTAGLVGDVNHALLTGFTDCGKDSWAASMLLSLALLNAPDKLQVAIIDGKGGLSWIGWENKAHVWLMAEDGTEILPAMDALKAERERRQKLLKLARCEKWEEYERGDMPLLVVFVSELMLLQDATSKTGLADWLNTELTSARAAGIRYIISSQTVTRMDTRWRSQIGLYIAGYQPRDDADEPNTSFSTKDLLRLGTNADSTIIGMPPSALAVPPAGQGVFTCVQGRAVITVRSTYVNKAQRLWLLDQLPNKALQSAALPATAKPTANIDDQIRALQEQLIMAEASIGCPTETPIGRSDAENTQFVGDPTAHRTPEKLSVNEDTMVSYVELPLPAEVVPFEEQRRIIEHAKTVKSKRQLSLALYGVDGGQKYAWVKQVCEATGLLTTPTQAPERAAA